ncbi:glycosyltransferase family 2 protein [Luteimonas sp. 50]|uniref:Glycosyltransferase family 2 protein n=1 Tax=Cognatiluteimonas sedimenti TaxID=2927791 RepID=A0ABT0A6T2_9GAMM|nr:glycosyltransferase family 2 protein [Lysobacter sedimenti]MCJ0826690.1 glycosyltransferase family 2 protein [Lysobacter sedimenti]
MTSANPEYSVVIPVFNSQDIVLDTLRRTAAFFESRQLSYEIIAVNDGSSDCSWEQLAQAAAENPRIVAIDLLRNSGQHNANLCGFRASRGQWLVTMDDDLQNPPEEIAHLIEKAKEGFDLVLGRFHEKQHAGYRKLGSRAVRALNQRIFGQEPDLVLSNFRLMHRDVVDRVCAYRGPFPYIPGLCLRFSGRRANAMVEHHPRRSGSSNYNWRRILTLVSTILFNYSSFPLRLVAALGIFTAIVSLLLGLYYLAEGIFGGARVPGWTTLVVMLAFFNGMTMLMLAMLGEYVVRIINQLTIADPYFVRRTIRDGA